MASTFILLRGGVPVTNSGVFVSRHSSVQEFIEKKNTTRIDLPSVAGTNTIILTVRDVTTESHVTTGYQSVVARSKFR